MIALVDTNVLLSAALRDRLPERVVLHVAMHDEWLWLVTPDILQEYHEVLPRPKFRLSPETLRKWIELVEMRSLRLEIQPLPLTGQLRDPKDRPFLAAAIATAADYLITGDKDLLTAQPFVSTRIVTVAEFARLFGIS
jgi:uncharacterized protein